MAQARGSAAGATTPALAPADMWNQVAYCLGFSFTIMYLVLPQFGTGSVYGAVVALG